MGGVQFFCDLAAVSASHIAIPGSRRRADIFNWCQALLSQRRGYKIALLTPSGHRYSH